MKNEFKGHANKGGVYQIKNIQDGKVYIGSAKSFKKRAYQHQTALKNNKHHNKHLQASWDKHGADAFLFEVVEVVEGDKGERFKVEQKYINQLIAENKWKTTFNFKKKTVQKERSCSTTTPEETRKRKSAAVKKRMSDPKVKDEFSKRMKTRWQDPEYRKKMSKLSKETWQDPIVREKRSKKIAEYYSSDEAREQQSIRSKKALAKPEWKAAQAKRVSERWKDPEYRKRVGAAISKAKLGKPKKRNNT